MSSKPRLILVEGIPGSGKTTTAKRIHEHLQEKGVASRLYVEGDSNPTDFAWMSVFPRDAYEQALASYPEWAEQIERSSFLWREAVIVPYLKLQQETGAQLPRPLRELFSRYEPYDGKLSGTEFCAKHRARYHDFAEEAGADGTVNILESSYLQNQINELLAFDCFAERAIIDHLIELGREILPLSPLLIYLTQKDVHTTLSRVAAERTSPDKTKWPDWIETVISYCEKSPYGKKHGLYGFDGAVTFFARRKQIELKALAELPFPSMVFQNDEYDVEGGLQRILARLLF